jgi:hypothetical protein
MEQNIRSVSGTHDPTNHVKTKPLNDELQLLALWDQLRCGKKDLEADWPKPEAEKEGEEPPLLFEKVDEFLDGLLAKLINQIGLDRVFLCHFNVRYQGSRWNNCY